MSSNTSGDKLLKMTELTERGSSGKSAKSSKSRRPRKATAGAAGSSDPLRVIRINDSDANAVIRKEGHFDGNTVVTSKYTALSFVPKNLMEFFRVVANIYFLVISALQVGTNLSPTNPYTTITPLTIVFIISMVKQGMEDLKRHQADARMNAREAVVLRGGMQQKILWRNVRAGDIMLVRDREEVPADVVVLATSEEEGRCFTETSNLDGETNLKRRVALKTTSRRIGEREAGGREVTLEQQIAAVSKLRGSIEYETPNNSLYTFVGTVALDDPRTQVPVGPSNVILRGCLVRSCKYILGLVVFTGKDTKIMQNSRPTPFKQSAVYRMVNKCIIIIFATQFFLCTLSTIMYWEWNKSGESRGLRLWYLDTSDTLKLGDGLTSFVTFLILFNNLVPISLYVSLDMIKVVQAKLMEKDMAMCLVDKETGEKKFAKARTSDLNEDLGQIEYIFSDKTGTLTRNIMEFRKCSINGIAYGFGTTEIGRAAMKRQRASGDSKTVPGTLTPAQVKELSNPKKAQAIYDRNIHFDDPRLLKHLREGGRRGTMIHEFLTLLAVCHTVIPERNAATGEVTYRAASPDEEALVKAAKCLGYDFLTPAPVVTVDMTKAGISGPKRASYEIVNVNEFNSTRKRMSVVVKTGDGKYILYCKGADSVMYERALGQGNDRLLEHLRMFASEGLRTLVLARRQLSKAEYVAWNQAYQRAANSTRNRSEMLEKVAEKVEVNLQIVGATAIEDKLQEGVPRCIADLAEAGIKIWVLTGDKEETAINIGYACKLLTNNMKLICLNQSDVNAIKAQLNVLQKFIASRASNVDLALVVDGKALRAILINRHEVKDKVYDAKETALRVRMTKQFLSIARHCKAVVACRVSPAQKAAIVKVVRKGVKPQPLTLAIGDGANDVNMIQTAHVGVGISGQEGVQAVNSSDYAIAQFRFLKPLLLVHGRQNYKRIAKVILYSFYKNIALVIVLFLYNFWNAFSGTTLFESFVMAGWNFFLAMPIIVIGIADYDVIPYLSMKNPALYVSGPWRLDLNVWRFLIWIINAIGHAMIAYFLPIQTMQQSWASSGQMDGLYVKGTTIYSCLLMTMNYKVALETRCWSLWNHFFFWGSIALYMLFLVIYNVWALGTPPFYWSAFVMFSRPTFWLLLVLVPFVCIIFDLVTMHLIRSICPVPGQVLAERYKFDMPVDDVRVMSAAVTADTVNPLNDLPSGPGMDEPVDVTSGMVDLARVEHTGYDFNTAVNESHFAAETEDNFFNRMRRRASSQSRESRGASFDERKASTSSLHGSGAGRASGAGAGAGAARGARNHALAGSQRR